MKISRSLLSLLALAASSAHAQQVTSAAATPPSRDEVVELSPFTVSTTEDRGYQAQSSLGGSRLKANLKDVASPTSAFTQQFLEDVAVTSTDDLARFMLSTEYDYGEDAGGQNRLNNASRPMRMRGLAGGSLAVNFFKSSFKLDTFSTERIDQTRGPNAVLFGIGDPGGSINVSTKRAMLATAKGSVAVQAKSHESLREELDFNAPLWRDRVAVRVAAVQDRSNTWRNYEYSDENRLFGTVKWRLAQRTELNLEGEKGDIDKATKRTYTALDGYTLWRDAGRQSNVNAVPAAGIARVAGNNVPWLVLDTNASTLTNMRNTTTSMLRTSVDGENIALNDFGVLPRETAIYGPGYYQANNYSRISAYLTHSFTPNLNLEIAAMRLSTHQDNSDPQLAAGQALRADTQPTLPSGAPNPNVGRTYFEALPQRNVNTNVDDAVRSILAYTKDLGRWGKHTLAGMYQYDFSARNQKIIREQVISANAPNLTAADGPANNQNRVFRRTYVDINGPSDRIVMADYRLQSANGMRETLSGATYVTDWIPFNANTQLNSSEGSTAIGMLQSSFWKNRIQTIVGGSRDERTDYLGTQLRTPQPGFTNGILYPIRSHQGQESKAESVSFSGVFHSTDWLALTYSKAQNSALPLFSGFLNAPAGGQIRPPTAKGRSEDVGIKLDLLKGRLFLTAQYFQTQAERDFDFIAVMTTVINPVWNALDSQGILGANNMVLANVNDQATGASFDSRTQGYELELTANPTEQWRLFLNYSNEKTSRTNIGQEQQAYIANFREFWLRYGSTLLVDGTGRTVAQAVAGIEQSAFSNFVLADQKRPLGQIQHKLNLRTNYDFKHESLRGVSIGGGARYLSKPVIGFTATGTAATGVTRTAYFGSEQLFMDFNASYRRKLPAIFGRSVQWTLQLNVNNVLDNDSFIRLRQASNGALLNYRWNPPREWIVTSRFAF